MKKLIASFALLFASCSMANAGQTSTISFNGEEYSYRATVNSFHQYTPADQADLSARRDMISFTFSKDVKTKADLKKFAEDFLSSKHGKGKVIKAIAGPNPKDPEQFMLAMMNTSENRSDANMFVISVDNSTGVVMKYSHSFYGKDQAKAVMDWFNENGRQMEVNLISFKDYPRAEDFN